MKNRWLQKIEQRIDQERFGDLAYYYQHELVYEERPIWWPWFENFVANLKLHILPGSVVVKYNDELYVDDGKGKIKNKDGKIFSTINYECGIICRRKPDLFTVSYEFDFRKAYDAEAQT